MIEIRGSRGNEGYAEFRAALLNGRLKPSVTLTQAEMCDILGMSLSPLRDTLTLLESDGLVQVRHRAGITVVNPDVSFIRRNFQFRTLIERESVLKLAASATKDWLKKTIATHERALERVKILGEVPELEEILRDIDWSFHTDIVGVLRNELIAETHFRLLENLKLARVLNEDFASPSKVADALQEHMVILEQLAARDAKGAVDALDAHFRAAIHRAFAS